MNTSEWALLTFTILGQLSAGALLVLMGVRLYVTAKAGLKEIMVPGTGRFKIPWAYDGGRMVVLKNATTTKADMNLRILGLLQVFIITKV